MLSLFKLEIEPDFSDDQMTYMDANDLTSKMTELDPIEEPFMISAAEALVEL